MRRLLIVILLIMSFFPVLDAKDIRDEIPPIAIKHFMNGMLAELEGDLDKALSSYLIALNFVPDNQELIRSVADLYMKIGMKEKALMEYLDLIDLNPENEYYRRSAAEAAFSIGDYKEARKQLEWIIEEGYPGYGDRIQYAIILMNMGNSSGALKSLDKTIEIYPQEPEIWGLKGNIHIEREEYRKAVESFRKSVELDPTYLRGYMGMSSAYEALGMRDSLLSAQEAYVKLNPDNIQINRQWINMLIIEEKFDRALEAAEYYFNLVTDDWELLRRIAFLAFYNEEYSQSAKYFERLLEWDPTDRESRLFYARDLLAMDSSALAIEQIKTVLAQERDADGVITLALAYENVGSVDVALEILCRSSAEFADNASIPLFEGVIAGHAGDYETAIEAYKRALQIEPFNQDAMFGLGDALENTGHRGKAIEIFRELHKKNQKDPLIANYLGYLLIESNRELKFAEKLVSFAIDKDSNNAAYIDSYGWYLYRIGKYEEALDSLHRADSLAQPSDPVILEHIGEVYEKLGKPELAVNYYKKALELNPDMEHSKTRLIELE